MLESALYYKSTFRGYKMRDNNFEWLPDENEWNKAEKVCKLLQVFSDATNLFSGSLYPTANLFLVEVFRVKKVIHEAYHSGDKFLVDMSKPMYEKFNKYWGEIGVLMAIASILDPRFKLLSVEFTFKRLYPVNEVDNKIKEVTSKLKCLYEKYSNVEMTARKAAKVAASTSDSAAAAAHTVALSKEDDFYAFLMTTEEEGPPKFDLDVYLEEPKYSVRVDGTFDVLKWWNQNSSKYHILSKLACDVLCIPITTVASKSAFSAGGRILDDYRSSLSKDMVEILVCGSDWIKANSKTTLQTLQKSAKEEEELETQIPTINVN
ncbi:zinc finger BED domain-containing protein RICESLEEPER 2-like [Carex rostrata]